MDKPYIYLIKDKKEKIIYVGQHNGKNKYYFSGSKILKNYQKKYGTQFIRDNFIKEIIEYCDLNILNEREIFWIKYYNTYLDGFNLTEGGDTLANCVVKGKSFPQKNKKLKGFKRSQETKILMKKSKIGYKPDLKCHEKRTEMLIKAVLQYDLEGNFIREWPSAKDAWRNGIVTTYGEISACCLNKVRTACGYIWRFKEKDNIELKITPEKRKIYKPNTKRIKNQSIEINNKIYPSITAAAKDLGYTFGKLHWDIKNNKIDFKWINK